MEEKSPRSTLTYFKGYYYFFNDFTVKYGELCSKLLSAIFKVTETLVGVPVILLVRHHEIMK